MTLLKSVIKIEVLTFLVFLGSVSCTTQKNTFITRTFHNVTSKYNVLFNGSESFKKGQRTMLDNHRNDYSELLPVFLYEDQQLHLEKNQPILNELKVLRKNKPNWSLIS